jgi:beta-lactamase regulating signal transducer with metallopeptidase domain
MSTQLLLEAALRSLIMGATIWAALRLMRIRQVRAQRIAWLLALAGALAMPALVGGHIGPRLLPQIAVEGLLQPVDGANVRSAPAAAMLPASAAVRSDLARSDFNPHPQSIGSSHPRNPLRAAALSLVALGLYCFTAAVLLARLCVGAGLALRLRDRARRTPIRCAAHTDVRISSRIVTPVTIASTVLLPINYASWDEPTLRIVLTHERAHVRQRDFYVQLLAGLHCALFWFNPFSWWLQRELSELGEALSDRAAVELAPSRAAYAEILLAFATRAQWPLTGVAMARASSLTPRIERLLNDHGFEQSFAVKRRPAFAAAAAVALAMLASTSMVRVNAAAPDAVAPPIPAPPPMRATPASPPTPPTPPSPASPAPAPEATDLSPHGADEILAIHSGVSRVTFHSENRLPPIPGDYIYYRQGGKTYLIQDANTLAEAHALLAPMQELGRLQEELGEQQAQLGQQQKALGMQQHLVDKVQTPEFKRDLAELEVLVRQMDLAHLAEQIDQKALTELQAHLGELQGRVGALQADLSMHAGRLLGDEQGALGERQGKLGEQERRLGEQQRRMVEEAQAKLRPLIEQAIREGNAKPVH